ncbi:MAG TPA: hypothetical protein VFQ32_10190 [Ktedonobacterales bacterium]|nr:hypothetical protein [Ktedonobacterales bacterium]
MAALPYQCSPFAALRRKAPIRAWRSATCVALAITSLMAAAITWTPVTAAASCAGTSSAPAAYCQPQAASSGLFSSAQGGVFARDDVRYIAHVSATTYGKAQAVKKTVRANNTSSSNGGAGSGGSNLPAATGGLPCQQSYMFVSHISQWTTPPGCYAKIYYPDRSIYHAPGNFGYCNWWVLALHPNQQDILYGKEYTHTSAPVPGAAVWFDPNVQGASSEGHWAQAVAVSPDGYWVLITEMNFGWRGGGFGRVDFRYIHVGPGVVFIH